MKHLMLVVVATLVGMMFGLMIVGRVSQPGGNSTTPTVGNFWPSRLRPVVTLAEYSELRSSMGYWEVRSIIGESGTEVSRNHMDGVLGVMEPIETVMYSWSNADGSNMNAMFQNDRLIQKAQFGLQ